MKLLAALLLCGLAQLQNPEAGRLSIEQNGKYTRFILDSSRPLDSAAVTLAERFGIAVSVEDPPYLFTGDLKDVTAEVSRIPNPPRHILVPKGGTLEIGYASRENGAPEDLPGMLNRLVSLANEKFPFGYRVDCTNGVYTLIPSHTRDALGKVIEIIPILDRHVTIPDGHRTIIETTNLMMAQLSSQTGLRVSCCQASIAGYPWGMTKVVFAARDEPARNVLRTLIALDLQGNPAKYHWLLRTDPAGWCFINLSFVR